MFDLKAKLQKARDSLTSPLGTILGRGSRLSEDDREAIEELLLGADVGVDAVDRIMDDLRDNPEGDYRAFLRNEFLQLLESTERGSPERSGTVQGPRVTIVIGVNGVGKTTTIAKLAHHLIGRGETVLLAACDTFRAAAADQLAVWAERLGLELVRHREGGDPGAVAFDACSAAKARNLDRVIVDTAGRMHTRVDLMEELGKIKRVCEKVLGEGAVETLLVLDATLGQNSLIQAQEFTKTVSTDSIVLTKLDSTAKGGIVLAIGQTLSIPVRYIGVGETIDDFGEFSPAEFVDALLG